MMSFIHILECFVSEQCDDFSRTLVTNDQMFGFVNELLMKKDNKMTRDEDERNKQ